MVQWSPEVPVQCSPAMTLQGSPVLVVKVQGSLAVKVQGSTSAGRLLPPLEEITKQKRNVRCWNVEEACMATSMTCT
jgi:hypothetical protein